MHSTLQDNFIITKSLVICNAIVFISYPKEPLTAHLKAMNVYGVLYKFRALKLYATTFAPLLNIIPYPLPHSDDIA